MAVYSAKVRASPQFRARVKAARTGQHSPGYQAPSYTLPASKLTPAQLQARIIAQRIKAENLNPANQPGAVLSGHALVAAANAQASGLIDPGLAAYDAQAQKVSRLGKNQLTAAEGYYASLVPEQQRQAAAQQAASGQLTGALDTNAQQAAAATTAAGQTAAQGLQADEQLRGQGLSGGADQMAANANAQRQAIVAANSEAAKNLGAQTVAGEGNLLEAIHAAQGMEGSQARNAITGAIANQLADLGAKRTELAATRGVEQQKARTSLLQTGFENQLTAKEFRLKAKTEGDQAAYDRTQAQIAAAALQEKINQDRKNNDLASLKIDLARQAELDRKVHNTASDAAATQSAQARADQAALAGQKFTSDKEKDAYLRLHHLSIYAPPKKGAAPAEPKASISAKVTIQNMLTFYKQHLGQGQSQHDIAAAIRKQYSDANATLSPVLLSAAADIATTGHLFPATLRALKNEGVTNIPKEWISGPKIPTIATSTAHTGG